jgi:hypothetical protein
MGWLSASINAKLGFGFCGTCGCIAECQEKVDHVRFLWAWRNFGDFKRFEFFVTVEFLCYSWATNWVVDDVADFEGTSTESGMELRTSPQKTNHADRSSLNLSQFQDKQI